MSTESRTIQPRGPSLRVREARLAYALVIPTVIIVLLIIVFPVAWNIVLSFKPIRLQDLPTVNLFDLGDLTANNFSTAIGARAGRFWSALRVTFIYTIASTILAILLGLWAALTVRDAFPGRNVFRGLLLFPYIAPVVSVAFVWRLMLDKNIGVVNLLGTRLLGLPSIGYLTTRSVPINIFGLEISAPIALITVILFEAWRYFPFAFLFLLARLQAVPRELYEAAAVDGATPLQRMWHITLPQLRAVMGTLFLLRFIWTFNKFEDIFLLNGGAAGTEVITVQIYNWLFSRRNVGVASAVAVVLALILGAMVFVYLRWFLPEEE